MARFLNEGGRRLFLFLMAHSRGRGAEGQEHGHLPLNGGRRGEAMEFVFSEPFAREIGRNIRMVVKDPAPLRVLIARLPSEVREVLAGRAPWSEDQLLSRVLFFREGRLIDLGEPVGDPDVVKVMLTATGG